MPRGLSLCSEVKVSKGPWMAQVQVSPTVGWCWPLPRAPPLRLPAWADCGRDHRRAGLQPLVPGQSRRPSRPGAELGSGAHGLPLSVSWPPWASGVRQAGAKAGSAPGAAGRVPCVGAHERPAPCWARPAAAVLLHLTLSCKVPSLACCTPRKGPGEGLVTIPPSQRGPLRLRGAGTCSPRPFPFLGGP